MKRTFSNQIPHDTYYVYDDYGNLTYVLPPMINTNGSIVQYYKSHPFYSSVADLDMYNNGFVSFYNDLYISIQSNISVYISEYDDPNSSLKTGKILALNLPSSLQNITLGDITYLDYDTWDEIIVGNAYIQNGWLYFNSNGTVIPTEGEFYMNESLESFQSSFIPDPVTQNDLNDFGYQYKYDQRNRLVEKKIPGKEWEYIVYDKLDRPVLMQDRELEKKGKWMVTKYDVLGRVVYTGFYHSNSTRESLQTIFNNKSKLENFEEKITSSGYKGTKYTGNDFPQNIELLTINYYDNYSFNLAQGSSSINSYGLTSTNVVNGLATGTKSRVLVDDVSDINSNWITTIMYYDSKARAIGTYVKNSYLETFDTTISKLDFTGKTLETKTTHKKTGKKDIITIDKLEYDHSDRLLIQKQTITVDSVSTAEELIVKNYYDELGQLEKKDVGNTEISPLQEVDYKYNVRGWLKSINDVDNLQSGLFSFKINYNDPIYVINNSTTALYNGNISQVEWRTNNTDNSSKSYTYKYDDLNRIISAKDDKNKFSLNYINYDKNGNIETLNRKGPVFSTTVIPDINNTSFGTMDNLYYTYEGNKLMGVRDTSNNDYGFKDGTNPADDYDDDYRYDDNGNMVMDLNKGIGSINTDGIEYNHLNLPKKVTINGGTINYIYDATGVKQQKIVSSGETTDYAGNYIYENNELQFFNHPEGYVQNNKGIFSYVYQYKDHLGNIRLSYTDSNDDGIIKGKINATTIVFNDDVESSPGWGSNITTITTEKARSGTHSVKIVNPNYNQYQYAHSDTWVPINNSIETEYIFSGWFYSTGPRARILLFMNENEETGYYTQVSSSLKSDVIGQWTYIEQSVMVPVNIDKLNLRIDTYGGGYDSAGTVWFDDLKIERVVSSTDSEIVEESNYYPFGLKHKGYNNVVSSNGNSTAQKFGFGGKELNEELGLEWMDFGARNYNPAIGRWMNIDPAADVLESSSQYVYALNSPIVYLDLDGELPILINGKTSNDSERGDASYWTAEIIATIRGSGIANPGGQIHYVDGNRGFSVKGARGFSNGTREVSTARATGARERVEGGRLAADGDFQNILAQLERDPETDKIVEKIQIYTHSRGGAFGVGYTGRLLELIQENSSLFADANNVIDFVLNLAPHQSNDLTSPEGVDAFSIDREWDMLSGDDMGGLTGAFKSDAESGDLIGAHSISTFVNDITSFTLAFLNSDGNNETLVNGFIERMRALGITVTVKQ